MFRRIVILFFILILSSLAIAAQETGDVEPEANACNEGGSMAGKCNIDFDGNGEVDDYEIAWAWTCGWYMVRYSTGIFVEVPSFCQSLLPSEAPNEENVVTRVLCIQQVTDVHFQVWDTFGDGVINDGSSAKVGGETLTPPKLPVCIDNGIPL